jgi:hypothetical protein
MQCLRGTAFRGGCRCDSAEAAFAAMELGDGGGQVVGREVGPHARREQHLRIRALPQKKIAQALLTAGADQQVDIGTERASKFIRIEFASARQIARGIDICATTEAGRRSRRPMASSRTPSRMHRSVSVAR